MALLRTSAAVLPFLCVADYSPNDHSRCLYRPISNTPQGYSDLADRYEQQIIQKIENLSPDEKKLKEDINNAVLKWNKDIQNLLLLKQNEIDQMAQGQIDKALTEYNKFIFYNCKEYII